MALYYKHRGWYGHLLSIRKDSYSSADNRIVGMGITASYDQRMGEEMTDIEIMYRAIELWRDGDKDGAILLARKSFSDTANKSDVKMTDDERALLLAIAKAVYKHFSTGPRLIPDDQRPSADDMIAMIRKLDPDFNYDWRKILKDSKPQYRWYDPASW